MLQAQGSAKCRFPSLARRQGRGRGGNAVRLFCVVVAWTGSKHALAHEHKHMHKQEQEPDIVWSSQMISNNKRLL